jgi:hypothetical protein
VKNRMRWRTLGNFWLHFDVKRLWFSHIPSKIWTEHISNAWMYAMLRWMYENWKPIICMAAIQKNIHQNSEYLVRIKMAQKTFWSRNFKILAFEGKAVGMTQILSHNGNQRRVTDGFLLSSYKEYIESIGFTPKFLKNFYCSNHVFYR